MNVRMKISYQDGTKDGGTWEGTAEYEDGHSPGEVVGDFIRRMQLEVSNTGPITGIESNFEYSKESAAA